MVTDRIRSFFKEIIEGGSGIAGGAERPRTNPVPGSSRDGRPLVNTIARDGHARRKELAGVGLVLHGNTRRDGLHALKASGRLKIDALLAAMQTCAALRTLSFEIRAGRERGGTAKTS